MGWAVMMRDGVESHEHVGTYGAYVAYPTIQPSRDIAVGLFANITGGQDLRDARRERCDADCHTGATAEKTD
jgi:hypothetical protein